MTGPGRRKPSVKPHRPIPDPDAPGTCSRCHLIRKNGAHDPDRIAAVEADAQDRQDAMRSRLGERED